MRSTRLPLQGQMIGRCDKCQDEPVKLTWHKPTKEWLDDYCKGLRIRAAKAVKQKQREDVEQATWDELNSLPDKPT